MLPPPEAKIGSPSGSQYTWIYDVEFSVVYTNSPLTVQLADKARRQFNSVVLH